MLNRFGQTRRVEVVALRNPDTVEARIWDRLDAKVGTIMRSLGRAMDEPEDLMQLVLGMTSPALLREVFAGASDVPAPALADWFDRKTARLGGQDAVDAVRQLIGHCARFDFGEAATRLPRLDLEALRPFLRGVLKLNKRQLREDDSGLAFRTPEDWLVEPRVRKEYAGLTFDRELRGKDAATRVVGVGHPAIDQALIQASRLPACTSTVPKVALPHPLLVFRVLDRVTGGGSLVRAAILGFECDLLGGGAGVVLPDWKLLERLNRLPTAGHVRDAPPPEPAVVQEVVSRGMEIVSVALPGLDLGFRHPATELLTLFWPA